MTEIPQVVAADTPRKPKPTKPKPKASKAQRKRWLANEKRRLRLLRRELAADPDSVLTFNQWVALNGLSARQGRRMLAEGTGPVVTKLTDKKIGISRAANRAWLESRARPPK